MQEANKAPAVTEEKKGTVTGAKKKRGFWGGFVTFLTMGGWILVLIVIIGIVIAVSILTSPAK